jgi:hypothetical protein
MIIAEGLGTKGRDKAKPSRCARHTDWVDDLRSSGGERVEYAVGLMSAGSEVAMRSQAAPGSMARGELVDNALVRMVQRFKRLGPSMGFNANTCCRTCGRRGVPKTCGSSDA